MNVSKLSVSLIFAFFCGLCCFAAPPPSYRGAMISPIDFDAEDLEVLGEKWNANLIRWQINGDCGSTEKYLEWLESECCRIDAILPLLNKYGVKVCIDLHSPPGGFDDREVLRVFVEKKMSDIFIESWVRIATRYRGEPAVWGYDLLNEPVEGEPDASGYHISWHDLAELTGKRIREVDPEAVIIFEPSRYAKPKWFEDLKPLNLPNVVYSFHQYIPIDFTHQGVLPNTPPVSYPGEIAGEYWDKEKLRETMAPVLAFQKKYNVPIFVGEFSAIRWAPENSAYNYLKDAIELFEEYGWDWTYHAFREWDGWSVEYSSDKTAGSPAAEPTDRELLLRSYFKKNSRAAGSP